jgi:hypothetical protein
VNILDAFEQLIGIKKKPQAAPQRPIGPAVAQGVTRYEDGSARVGQIGVPNGQAGPVHPLMAVQAVPTQAQGYPGNPDDADQFGAAAATPQGTIQPQGMQPTQRPFMAQGNFSPDRLQYGTSPQLDYLRRLRGF